MDTFRLKVKGWINIFQVNDNQKKSTVAILLLSDIDKINFKSKTVTRDKD